MIESVVLLILWVCCSQFAFSLEDRSMAKTALFYYALGSVALIAAVSNILWRSI